MICFSCALMNYPIFKTLDNDFIEERKGEFYPTDSWGDVVVLCEDHYNTLKHHDPSELKYQIKCEKDFEEVPFEY